MNEEKKSTTTTDSKLSSRKFIVWLIWLILTIGVGAYTFVAQSTALLEKTLDSFFAISMMYLGMNAGQKIGFALSDALVKNKHYSKEEEDE